MQLQHNDTRRTRQHTAIEEYFAEKLRWDGNKTAEIIAREFGLVAHRATLVDVPEPLGGGWLVLIKGPSYGVDGFIAHIDRQGGILRVAMNPDGSVPGGKTPIAEVMDRLVDTPNPLRLSGEIDEDEDDIDDEF